MYSFFAFFLFCFAVSALAQQTPPQTQPSADDVKQVANIWFVAPRTGQQHIGLSNDWQLGWQDNTTKQYSDIETVQDWTLVKNPASVPQQLFHAGKLPDPYKNLNIKQHKWEEQKIWFYKKEFTVPKPEKDSFIFLSFDGLDYYSRVYLNGKALGKHEGMFGGPEFEISSQLNYDKPNELLVTVASANYGNPNYSSRTPGTFIKPWSTSGGSGVEPFFTFGMWRGVRLDITEKTHLERPFIQTETISADKSEAALLLETEILSGNTSLKYNLHPWGNAQLFDFSNPNASGKFSQIKTEIKVRLTRKEQVIEETIPLQIADGRTWVKHRIKIKNPVLWQPNGLGEAALYKTEIELLLDGRTADKIVQNTIRTIDWTESAGKRLHSRWGNWQCVINGAPVFLKGVNWMPADTLLDLPREKFRWRLKLAKDAGIQIIRIWGPGHQESEDFYDFCDEFGIMVWQDFPVGNFDTPDWNQEVWEEQVMHTIYRLRSRASLAVWCGGNEFNPYSRGNTATIGVLERNIRLFDGSRKFLRTTPDEGCIHGYPDMCPSWYKKTFADYPYIAETGIHSMASPYWLSEYMNPEELKTAYKMWDKDFRETHPDVALHFVEYSPGRVPRMLSRASHIIDTTAPSIDDLTLATQLGAEEFYQIMSEGIQANYPVTTGLMPWVFARSWAVIAGIQLVDGVGQPLAPYYALKRTYELQHVMLDIERLLWKSGETFPVRVKSLNAPLQKGFNGTAVVKIYDNNYKVFYEKKKELAVADGIAVNHTDFEPFTIPADYKSKYFYAVAELNDAAGKLVSRAVYRPRTIADMEEGEFFKKFTSAPVPFPMLREGPYLKNTIENSPKTVLNVKKSEPQKINELDFMQTLTITNTGNVPCPLVILDIASPDLVVEAADNYFWLAAGETKTVPAVIHYLDGKEPKPVDVNVRAWNVK